MPQPQGVRLRGQRAPRAHPAQDAFADGHFGKELVVQRTQRGDRGGRIGAVVGEGDVDAASRELARDARDVARRRAQHEADVALVGLDAHERVDAQDDRGERADLVGRHRPGADPEEQHQLEGHRGQLQAPRGNRMHATGRPEHDVDRLGVLTALAPRGRGVHGHQIPEDSVETGGALGDALGEARLHVLAQLVGVVGES